jgi:hypothetical protein
LLDTIPRLLPGTEWLWTAWTALATRRIRHPQPQPIQLSEINAYAEYLGVFGRSEHDLLIGVIGKLDGYYIEAWEQEAEKHRKKQAMAQKRQGRRGSMKSRRRR